MQAFLCQVDLDLNFAIVTMFGMVVVVALVMVHHITVTKNPKATNAFLSLVKKIAELMFRI